MSGIARAKVLAKQYETHNRLLQESMTWAAESPTVDDLDKLITTFIDQGELGGDHCHSELMEMKHQLNVLHSTMIDLTLEMNTTELEIKTTTTEIADVESNIGIVEKNYEDDKKKCDKGYKEHYD